MGYRSDAGEGWLRCSVSSVVIDKCRRFATWWDEFWYWAAICACWGFIAVVFLVGD